MKLRKWARAFLCQTLVVLISLTGCATSGQPSPSADSSPSVAASSTAASPTDVKREVPDNVPEKIKLALVGPMTGDNAQYGKQFRRGAELFVEDYNAKGGYHGAMVELTIFDDKNDAKESVNIANKIVAEGDYFCVLGPSTSTCAFAMAEVLDEEKILTIAPTVSHEDYVVNYDYTFRLSQVNSYEAYFSARYAKKYWDTQKVATIFPQNDWGISLNDAFVNSAGDIDLEIVGAESFILGQTKDFAPILTKLHNAGADTLLLVCQYAEAGSILRQAQDMGYDFKMLLCGSAYKAETLELAGDAAAGARWLTPFLLDNPDPKIQAFRKRVKETYDVEIDNWLIRTYDAGMMAFMALDNIEDFDSTALRDEIMRIKYFDGFSGVYSLMDDRNIERQYHIVTANETCDEYVYVETPDIATM